MPAKFEIISLFSEHSNRNSEKMGRKRMSFLVVHDISDASPYAILKVPENATTRDVIKQAVLKGGQYYGDGQNFAFFKFRKISKLK